MTDLSLVGQAGRDVGGPREARRLARRREQLCQAQAAVRAALARLARLDAAGQRRTGRRRWNSGHAAVHVQP